MDVDGREARKSHASNKYMGHFDKSCKPSRSNHRNPFKKESYKPVRYTLLDMDDSGKVIEFSFNKTLGDDPKIGKWEIRVPQGFSLFQRDAFGFNSNQFMQDFADQVTPFNVGGNADVDITITFNVDISQEEKNNIESSVYEYMQSNGIIGQIEYKTVIDPEQSGVYTIDVMNNNTQSTTGTFRIPQNNEQE